MLHICTNFGKFLQIFANLCKYLSLPSQVYGSTEKVAAALRGKAVGKNENGGLLQNSRWQGFAVPTMDDLGNCQTMEEWRGNARIFLKFPRKI